MVNFNGSKIKIKGKLKEKKMNKDIEAPHCDKHEILMSLIDPTYPEKGWYCQKCIMEKPIEVKGLDFKSMDQIALAAVVKKFCNGEAKLTAEELGNVNGLLFYVKDGEFIIKGQ